MFGRFFKKETEAALDKQIADILQRMDDVGVDHPDYKPMLKQLERLINLKGKGRPGPISWDTIASIAGNVVIAIGIVVWEQNHVSVSRGWSHLIPPKRPK